MPKRFTGNIERDLTDREIKFLFFLCNSKEQPVYIKTIYTELGEKEEGMELYNVDALLRGLEGKRGALIRSTKKNDKKGKFWYVKNDFGTIKKLNKIFFHRLPIPEYNDFLNSAFVKENRKKILKELNKPIFNSKKLKKMFRKPKRKDIINTFMIMFKTDPFYNLRTRLELSLKEEKKLKGLKSL